MRIPSLEELAERWTMAHTLAVVAWVVALVLGLALLLRSPGSDYPIVQQQKRYAGENATFTYPANWTLANCQGARPLLELPGTIAARYKGIDDYRLKIQSPAVTPCVKDRPMRFELYPEVIVASQQPCAIASSTPGERLSNGLYLQLETRDGGISAIVIRQNYCYTPENTYIMGFTFADPAAEKGDAQEFGVPTVTKETLLASPQYQDIKKLAQSFRY